MKSIYFNHLMKTGGRSITSAVKRYFEDMSWDFKAVHEMCAFETYDITITAIREPSERLLSHYRMLMQSELFNLSRPPHRDSKFNSDDPAWLDRSLELFLKKFPSKWKSHQLHFYSPSGDICEAFENITKNTQIILTEKQQEGFDRLCKKEQLTQKAKLLELKPPSWQTTDNIPFEPSKEQVDLIKNVLKDEYTFYNKVINYYNEEQL